MGAAKRWTVGAAWGVALAALALVAAVWVGVRYAIGWMSGTGTAPPADRPDVSAGTPGDGSQPPPVDAQQAAEWAAAVADAWDSVRAWGAGLFGDDDDNDAANRASDA